MTPDPVAADREYVIPARTISGSAQDILDELDEMIVALLAVRQEVVARTPKPARPERSGWVARAWRAVRRTSP